MPLDTVAFQRFEHWQASYNRASTRHVAATSASCWWSIAMMAWAQFNVLVVSGLIHEARRTVSCRTFTSTCGILPRGWYLSLGSSVAAGIAVELTTVATSTEPTPDVWDQSQALFRTFSSPGP